MRVIGVGNLLLTDEGVGVHVVQELDRRGGIPGVELVDGGVAGATLLLLLEGEEKVVVIDTVAAPLPPGTVIRLTPSELKRGEGPRYSLHDLNLTDAIGLMELRETLPEMLILGIVPSDIASFRIGLSEPLAARFDEILGKVRGEVERFAAGLPEPE